MGSRSQSRPEHSSAARPDWTHLFYSIFLFHFPTWSNQINKQTNKQTNKQAKVLEPGGHTGLQHGHSAVHGPLCSRSADTETDGNVTAMLKELPTLTNN